MKFNFDDPGFALALLAILGGLRLAIFVFERWFAEAPPKTEPNMPATTPDASQPEADVAPAAIAPGDDPHGLAPAQASVAATLDTGLLPPSAEEIAPAELPAPEGEAPAAAAAEEDVEPEPRASRFFVELLDSAIIAVFLVFVLIRPFLLQAFYIPSGSMRPTLMENDKLLATKITYAIRDPHRGEVVVFNAPDSALRLQGHPVDTGSPTEYVKRVIGVPGDTIRIVAGDGIYVNKVKLAEPDYIPLVTYDFPTGPGGTRPDYMRSDVWESLVPNIHGEELTVPPGQLFVMGDNRNQSSDSHMWGLLDRNRVIGKAIFIFWPANRFGVIR